MDLGLEGKRALVTGSTSGIGAATAKLLSSEGVTVVIHGRDLERAKRVAADIAAGGGTAVVALGDLTDEDAVAEIGRVVHDELGGVDILFNNAGGGDGRAPERGEDTAFLSLEPSDWLGQYNHNVVAAVRMIREFVPGMTERGWGRVIQNASASGTGPKGWENDYSAAKGAMINLSVGLSKALSGSGVTANTISPGLILTEKQLHGETPWLRTYARNQGWDADLPLSELEIMWADARGIATGHAGRVEHIAATVTFLASPLAGFITGANIRVDGGQNPTIN